FAAAEDVLVAAHAEAVAAVRDQMDSPAALIGYHGQTLVHRPAERFTLQIGAAEILAGKTGLPVVHDFRSADVAAGGQGAPLAPFYHHALARGISAADSDIGSIVFLNIGGVANVTWVDPTIAAPEAPGALLAFDTGPGNAQLNDWVQTRTGAPFDTDGALAAAGTVDRAALAVMTERAFLRQPPPKSLDRADFDPPEEFSSLSVEDGAATLAALTVATIAAAGRWFPRRAARWYVMGGGRLNATMMEGLRKALDVPVKPIEQAPHAALSNRAPLDGDMVEAQCFAYLAARAVAGLSLSAPGTTGVDTPCTGGCLAMPPLA
ncbi:MAG: anhydro-N-acetylmuramic acid kinase, partial [Pseudomonadota bacterium]